MVTLSPSAYCRLHGSGAYRREYKGKKGYIGKDKERKYSMGSMGSMGI